MMKKLIIILSILCLLCVSCRKEYTCKIDYEINYPDTTLVKSYSFKCNSSGKYYISEDKNNLYIYYTENALTQHEIDATSKEGKINVIKFRIFKENKEVGK